MSNGVWIRDVDRWFADLVAPYEKQYLWVAKRLTGEGESARDLVHDVYATLLTGEAWRSIAVPRTYVMRMVFNLGLKHVRRAQVVRMSALPDFETLEYAAQDLDGYETFSVREQVRVGMDAIHSLPDMTRRVLLMRRLDALPIKVIAHRLGMTVKGVEYHLTRGALLFKQAVEAANMGVVDRQGLEMVRDSQHTTRKRPARD
ncbi:RNA polymerase sigma factor [Asticcacaulis sp. BYS171W]|uniref:RNA polymerase sigma factor n=1 Tax=Asticcacaulis aquaticus TaxID=2984212 RepID=A0ABT5HQ19_9CAUL|nr:RNA polymerase sigma factor [Asticcacaulis aquaticus]MDC7682159.1 RNA polymerase sigma factor [Asticcacaulis aquaticus]